MESPEQAIINCLRISPCSVEELAHGLSLSPRRIAPVVRSLLDAGAIVRLEGRTDEGRAIYALAGYVESSERRDHSDVIFGRNYGGQYEAPTWRDDAKEVAHLNGLELTPVDLRNDRKSSLSLSRRCPSNDHVHRARDVTWRQATNRLRELLCNIC